MKRVDFSEGGKLVVGEGPSDSHFLERLCDKNGIKDFQFAHAGLHDASGSPAGWEHFGDYLRTLPDLPRFEQCTDIVIFCDASDDPKDRLNQVRRKIEAVSTTGPEGAVKYTVSSPNEPAKAGKPRLHTFLVPRIDGKGGLESLCLQAAAKAFDDEHKTIMQAVDEFAGKVCVLKGGKRWSVEKTDKLRLQAFISASTPRKPDIHFYRCFDIGGDKLIPLDSDIFEEIKKFLSAVAAF